jgi:multidrug efflux system outer membrane protein
VAQKENEISVLIGRAPAEIPRGRTLEAQAIPPQVPAGLPSALLERRPDIREAEQNLISANARIGEAKALLFPTISLTGSYGYASTDIDDFLESSTRSWSLLGGLLQPIFHAGENRRRVEVTESRQRQAVYEYEQTILQALREVEDSLVGLHRSGAERGSQGLRVAAERKVVELSELRYRGGVAAYLEVLDAQRSLYDAEIDEVASASEQFVSFIQLYRALGGGWSDPEAAVASQPGTEPTAVSAPAPAP